MTVEFGPIDQLTAKLVALETVLQQVDLHGTVTIDLRVPDAPVLTRPRQGGTVSTTPEVDITLNLHESLMVKLRIAATHHLRGCRMSSTGVPA